MKTITFYGSGIEIEKYKSEFPEIESVVKLISKHYGKVLFGGTNIGLMGKFIESAKRHNLHITSIVPKWFSEKYSDLIYSEGEIILAENLAERKKLLENTDAILCYPGGVGTLDELFNIIARVSLGEIEPLPIIIYNFERFYSPVLLQIEHGIKIGTIKKELMNFIYTFEHIDQLEEILDKIGK